MGGDLAHVFNKFPDVADGCAELAEVFDDAGELHNEIAEIKHDEGGEACFGGNEGGNGDAADEDEDAGELSQDAVDAALGCEFHLRIAPGGEAPEEKIEDHGDADEHEDVEGFAFTGAHGLLEGVEKFLRASPFCDKIKGTGHQNREKTMTSPFA